MKPDEGIDNPEAEEFVDDDEKSDKNDDGDDEESEGSELGCLDYDVDDVSIIINGKSGFLIL